MARIVIIGAGPAGSSAAYHLARAGHNLTIFERACFPRPKVCGEFISPAATHLLEKIIPESDLLREGARRVSTAVLASGNTVSAWAMPRTAWALSRGALDSLLLRRACEAGASVVQPACVRRVEYADSAVRVFHSEQDATEADIVIHADGSGRHDPAGPVPNCRDLIGLKCHFSNAAIGDIRMVAARGAYIGTIRVESALSTCALVARKCLLAANSGDIDAMVRALDPTFDAATREGHWLACPVPRSRYITPGHPRSFRIGNAAAAVDPVGGEGIGLAIWAGSSLARLLANSPTPDLPTLRKVHFVFAHDYRARLRFRFTACRAAAAMLCHPQLVRYLPSQSKFFSILTGAWYSLTGKGTETRIAPSLPARL